MPGKPAARVTDLTTHGSPLSPGPGSPDTLIGNLPAWRTNVDQHACPAASVSGADGVGSVIVGSPTVLINNQMACRIQDVVVEKPGLAMGPANPIQMGCTTVLIGEVGSPPSPQELALSASEGSSAEQQAARQKVAKAFYQEHSGMDPNRMNDHLKGIDYSKPVKVGTSPPPTTAVQWQAPNGRQGQYFGKSGTTPSEMGTGPLGLDASSVPLRVVSKEPRLYTIAEGTPVLESTATPMDDAWSFKDAGYGTQVTRGGGTQYYIPDRGAAG